jgi:ATP-dependent RNA helicase DeaD
VVDLRARRLDLIRGGLRERLLAGELDDVRVVVETLCEEFDLFDIACAGVKLAQERDGGGETVEEEIPSAPTRGDRTSRKAEKRDAPRSPRPRAARRTDADVTRLYIGVGRKSGVRPADIVGAIANEAGLDARSIGSIDITDRFTLVEVPDDAADQIIGALSGATLRGKRVTVRRDRDGE